MGGYPPACSFEAASAEAGQEEVSKSRDLLRDAFRTVKAKPPYRLQVAEPEKREAMRRAIAHDLARSQGARIPKS